MLYPARFPVIDQIELENVYKVIEVAGCVARIVLE